MVRIKKIFSITVTFFIIILLSGCVKTTLQAEETTIPSTDETSFTTDDSTITTDETYSLIEGKDYYYHLNEFYGSIFTQKYDIYLPLDYKEMNECKVIFLLHGGAWLSGDKNAYFDFDSLIDYMVTNYDAVVVNMDYRLGGTSTSSASVYDMIDDITACIESAKNTLSSLSIAATEMAIGGHSAGGHLALLYSYEYLNESTIPIKFVYSLSGPTDLTDEAYTSMLASWATEFGEENVKKIVMNLTDTSSYEEGLSAFSIVSPINYVTDESIPTLIFHGNQDEIVPYSNSTSLRDVLLSHDCIIHLITIEGGSHTDTALYSKMTLFLNELDSYVALYF